MTFGPVSIDPGTNPSVPVAIDSVSGADYQRIKLADPTADQTGAFGIDSNPMRVRPRRQGSADYDAGSVAVAGALTAVTTATIYLVGLLLVNLTSQVQLVDVTDTAGNEILKAYPLQPNDTKPFPFGDGLPLVGLKAGCGNASAVKLRAWGTQ